MDKKLLFISYARPDVEIAAKVEQHLLNAGYEIFRDVNAISTGQHWDMTIEDALEKADAMVLLLSPASMPYRKEVHREWFYFDQKQKPLYPLYISKCELHSRIYAYNYIDARIDLDQALTLLVEDISKPFDSVNPLAHRDRIVVTSQAEDLDFEETLRSLQQSIMDDNASIAIRPELIKQITNHQPRNLTEYYLERIVEWSQQRYHLDDRFVNLTLLIDQGENASDLRWKPRNHFGELHDVLDAVAEPVIVILGAPGCGKSTLLRRFQLDESIKTIRSESKTITYYAQLNQFFTLDPSNVLTPFQWLSKQWQQRYSNLPPLEQILKTGNAILLLDGINEIPHQSIEDYSHKIIMWRQFVQETVKQFPGTRLIFSCRSLDYSSPLSSPELRVPQIRIEAMNDEQIRRFLEAYAPAMADAIWDKLVNSEQLEMFRTPYYLRLLLDQIDMQAEIPAGHVELFTQFVRRTIRREIEQGNRLFTPGHILAERDHRRITQWKWRSNHDLPEQGPLIPSLVRLSFQMQESRAATQGTQVRIEYDTALEILESTLSEDILRAGVASNILEEDAESDEILFYHQLLQEFFAARELAKSKNVGLVTMPWRRDKIVPHIEAILDTIAMSDPLPSYPTTGWEETTILAVSMSKDQDQFIEMLIENNLYVAARCVIAPEVNPSWSVLQRIRNALLERMQEVAADIRSRLEAGVLLGKLGDPRFELNTSGEYPYSIGPVIELDQPITEDATLSLQVCQYPVTNSQYACFVDAGGYESTEWWQTPEARRWLEGYRSGSELRGQVLFYWEQFKAMDSNQREAILQSDPQGEQWRILLQMSYDDLSVLMDERFPLHPRPAPAYWHEVRMNNPSQPVVGITAYEAEAYCLWLSQQTGQKWRLLTSNEWQMLAQPWLDRFTQLFEPEALLWCNTYESHIRTTSPVGIFPETQLPSGIMDIIGNVYEWVEMHSPISEENLNVKRYGIRGGSWFVNRQNVNPDYICPTNAHIDFGFRICRNKS